MNTSRGFISLGIIIAIVIAITVFGGAGWWYTTYDVAGNRKDTINYELGLKPPEFAATPAFSASPTSGKAPLTVTFYNMATAGPRTADMYPKINYGDGTTENAARCIEGSSTVADTCTKPGENVHTYTSSGTYTAILSGGMPNKEEGRVTIMVDKPHRGTCGPEDASGCQSAIDTTSSTPSLEVTQVSADRKSVTVSYKNMPPEVPTLALCIPAGECTELAVEFTHAKPSGTFVISNNPSSSKRIGEGVYTIQAVDFAKGGKVFAVSSSFTIGPL